MIRLLLTLLLLQSSIASAQAIEILEELSPRARVSSFALFDKQIAVGTRGAGVYLISAENFESEKQLGFQQGLHSKIILSLAVRTGTLLIGTDKGLCSYNSDSLSCEELSQAPIHDIHVQSSGSVLLASDRGVLRSKNGNWGLVYGVHEFASRRTFAISSYAGDGFCAAKENGLVCFDAQGVKAFQRDRMFQERSPELSSNFFTALAYSPRKDLLLAGSFDGLTLLDRQGTKAQRFSGSLRKEGELASAFIEGAEYQRGQFFIFHGSAETGRRGAGFGVSSDLRTWRYPLKEGFVYAALALDSQKLLLGLDKGLALWNGKTLRQIELGGELSSGDIFQIGQSEDRLEVLNTDGITQLRADGEFERRDFPGFDFRKLIRCQDTLYLLNESGLSFSLKGAELRGELRSQSRNLLDLQCDGKNLLSLTKLALKSGDRELNRFDTRRPGRYGNVFSTDSALVAYEDKIPKHAKTSLIRWLEEGSVYESYLPDGLALEKLINVFRRSSAHLLFVFEDSSWELNREGSWRQRNFQLRQVLGAREKSDKIYLLERDGGIYVLEAGKAKLLLQSSLPISQFLLSEDRQEIWLAIAGQGMIKTKL